MMVTFKKDGYVIEVFTRCNPVEDWLELHKSLTDIIRYVDSERIADDTFYAAVDFIQHLMPDIETAKKMTE